MYSFSYLEPVCCSMSSSNCCFLTCIQISQKAGQVVWYSHLFQNCPQFILIHAVKSSGMVNKAEIDIFLELSCFFDDPADIGHLILGSSAFSKISLNIWKFMVHVLLKPDLDNFEHSFASAFCLRHLLRQSFCFLHFFFLGMVLITASCTMSRTSIHGSSGALLDLNSWIYLSLPLYNHKEFDLGHTWWSSVILSQYLLRRDMTVWYIETVLNKFVSENSSADFLFCLKMGKWGSHIIPLVSSIAGSFIIPFQ